MGCLVLVGTRWMIVTTIIISITLADNPTINASGDSIRVEDHSYEIDYGREIRFALSVASDLAPISEIQALFTLQGPDAITEYSYLDFEPALAVSASFAIPTIGRSFIPPGTPLEIRYRITDQEGYTLNTPLVKLDYLDPRFNWHRIRHGPVTVIYHDLPDKEINETLKMAVNTLPLIETTIGIRSLGPYRGVIINTELEADKAFPMISEASRNPHAFRGFAFERNNVFVLWGNDHRAFIHELSHLLIQEVISSPIGRMPAWLDEGLATFFETGNTAATSQRLRQIKGVESAMAIRLMNTVPGVTTDIPMFYAKSGNFTGYLIEQFGHLKVAELLFHLNRGTAIEDAITITYGMTIDVLDTQWETQFYRETNNDTSTETGSEDTRDLGKNPNSIDSPSTSGFGDKIVKLGQKLDRTIGIRQSPVYSSVILVTTLLIGLFIARHIVHTRQ